MVDRLRCSVIVPTYNRLGLLRHTLDSLCRQSLPPEEFEVLVVDDGSSDGTGDAMAEYRERLELRYFYQPDEGFRVAKARNVGIHNARADVCVFIDSGVLLHSGCLAAHIATHESVPGPAAVCGYVYGFNVDNEDAAIIEQSIDPADPDGTIATLAERKLWDIREEFYEKYTDDFNHLPAPWLVYWTCNVSARTEQLRAVGMFDEAFRSWGGEDLDLGYRLHRDGATFVLNRQAGAVHYPHEKSFDRNNDAVGPNYRYMAQKYGTPITQLLTLMPEITPFDMNDVIRERGLPTCAEYLAAGGGRG